MGFHANQCGNRKVRRGAYRGFPCRARITPFIIFHARALFIVRPEIGTFQNVASLNRDNHAKRKLYFDVA